MKRSLFILALTAFASVPHTLAAVGDTVNTTGMYVADGVSISIDTSGTAVASRQQSTRLYDSRKGTEWALSDTTQNDSNMCWMHAASNSIQYWQSYYGVFAIPQQGTYYDYDAQSNTAWLTPDETKPLPYGKIGTEAPSSTDSSTDWVPDGRRLSVARDMYFTIPNTTQQPRNMGGVFKWAAEWFFRGADTWEKNDGSAVDLTASGQAKYTGGYYKNYFGEGTYFEKDLSYTTVYSEAGEANDTYHNTSTGRTTFSDSDLGELKSLLLEGFGVVDGKQEISGILPCLGTYNASTGVGHFITCYGFTTDENGNLDSIFISDNNNSISSYNSGVTRLYLRVDEVNGKNLIRLYRDKDHQQLWHNTTNGNYIGEVSFINTPQVLKDMLAEYSDVANEAQIWNGKDSTWEAQVENVNELPTEATGWDINVDGTAIAGEHQGYYHTYSTDGRDVEFGAHAAEDKRNVTIVGKVTAQNINVTATGYSFLAGEGAELTATEGGGTLNIRNGAGLSTQLAMNGRNVLIEQGALLELNNLAEVTLQDLTLQTGSELHTSEGSTTTVVKVTGNFTVTAAATPQMASYSLRSVPQVIAPSVTTDLDLSEATSITLDYSVNMNGNDLILSSKTPLTLNIDSDSGVIPFFSDIGTLTIVDAEGSRFVVDTNTDLSNVLNIQNLGGYSLVYADGTLSLMVPEPATATLSLLALAALAARRRRR